MQFNVEFYKKQQQERIAKGSIEGTSRCPKCNHLVSVLYPVDKQGFIAGGFAKVERETHDHVCGNCTIWK